MKNSWDLSKQVVIMIRRLVLLATIIGLVAGCTARPPTPTQVPYPTRSITYLIPYDPGGQSDRIARQQAPSLKRILGQEVNIDYKAGGGGALGWTEAAKSTPDGYMMVAVNLPHIVLQPMFGKVEYKTEQLDCIATFATTPMGLAVLNNSPYKTLKELVDAAKAKPDEITVGGFAEYTAVHMVFLQLQKVTGTKFKYVIYAGGSAEQMVAFLGGNVDAVLANSDDLLKNKDKVRVLAMAEKFADLPDAPTFMELGLDVGPIGSIDRSVAVPAGTPDHVIKRLEAAFLEVARDPEFQAAMKTQGFVPMVKDHAETKATVEKLETTYKELADLVKP